MVGPPPDHEQRVLRPIRPRRHHLPSLPHNPTVLQSFGVNTQGQRPHPLRDSSRPPIIPGAPLAHRRGSKDAELSPEEQVDALASSVSSLRHTGMRQMLPRRLSASQNSPFPVEKCPSAFVGTVAGAPTTATTLRSEVESDAQPSGAAEYLTSPPLPLPPSSALVVSTEMSTALLQPQCCRPSPPAVLLSSKKPPCRRPTEAVAAPAVNSPPLLREKNVSCGYRATAKQFMRSIERLNCMTHLMCSDNDRSFFGLTQEMGAGGAVGVRKMARIPSLPLTLCTDGANVILVDPNGTERHGNYLTTINEHVRRLSTSTSTGAGSNSAASSASHTISRVLWWALSDLQRGPEALPLSDARATLSLEDFIGGSSKLSSAQKCHRSRTRNASRSEVPCMEWSSKTMSMLDSVKPDRWSLRYGESLVLLFVSAGTHIGGEAPPDCTTHTSVKAKVLAEAPPTPLRANEGEPTGGGETSHRDSAAHSGFELLRDIRYGYLPSFLEFIYPKGGVHLRGCWCDVSTSTLEALPTRSVDSIWCEQKQQQQLKTSRRGAGGGEAQRCPIKCLQPGETPSVLLQTVPTPLVDWSLQPTKQRSDDPSARSEEVVMKSLLPTSLPRSSCQGDAVTAGSCGKLGRTQQTFPDAVLRLLPDVQRFLAFDHNTHDGDSVTVPAGVNLSSSFPSNVRHTKVEHKVGSYATEASAESPFFAANELDVSPVCVGGDCRGVFECNVKEQQSQKNRHRYHKVDLVYVSALLHAPSHPPPMGMVENKTVVCESVVVLTPGGRVELVAPVTSQASSHVFTIADVEYSLFCSALGHSLGLRQEEITFIYAPGTEELPRTSVVSPTHAVLRLQRRAPRALPEFSERQPQRVEKR